MNSEIRGVVEATVKLVQEKLKAKWGSLEDCCTDANEMIYEMLKDGVELRSALGPLAALEIWTLHVPHS